MTISQFPESVVAELASREHRHRHLLWHLTREFWCRFPEESQARFLVRFPHWVPPHPSMSKDGSIISGGGAGFDFLGMHHNMISMVDRLLSRVRKPRLRAWDRFPANDEVPVPDVIGAGADEARCKSTWFWSVLDEECRQLRDPDVLRGLSLDELGTRIEFGIHNAMHLRFGERPEDGLRLGDLTLSDPVDPRFDNVTYHTLLDMYSAHVNPLFWKIHGWIDDCVVLWQAAHKVGPIDWTGAWEGPMHHHPGGRMLNAYIEPRVNLESDEAALNHLERAIEAVPGTAASTFPVLLK